MYQHHNFFYIIAMMKPLIKTMSLPPIQVEIVTKFHIHAEVVLKCKVMSGPIGYETRIKHCELDNVQQRKFGFQYSKR